MDKFILVKDEFNSEIFECNFGNIYEVSDELECKDISLIINKSDYDFVSAKINAANQKSLYEFQKAGFYIVDCLVTYEFDSVKNNLKNMEYKFEFSSQISQTQVEKLASIASKLFKIDRYHSDPNLNDALCDKYYYRWIENSFKGFADGCILPMYKGKIVGFTTYNVNNVDEDTSTMVLSGVDPKAQGMGVYGNMIHKGTKKLLEHSSKVRVGTQINNIAVQRTWQRLGYKLIEVNYVLHRDLRVNQK